MGLRASKTRKTLVFNVADYEKLQEVALIKDVSLSELIRDVIKNYLKEYEGK